MSTRAVVIIKDEFTNQKFYRHSDGYPSGVLPTLNLFMKYLKEGNIRDNVSQSCGWLVLFGAIEYNTYWDYSNKSECIKKEKTLKELFEPLIDWKASSYEPSNSKEIEYKVDYIYTIDLYKKTLVCHNSKGDRILLNEEE